MSILLFYLPALFFLAVLLLAPGRITFWICVLVLGGFLSWANLAFAVDPGDGPGSGLAVFFLMSSNLAFGLGLAVRLGVMTWRSWRVSAPAAVHDPADGQG